MTQALQNRLWRWESVANEDGSIYLWRLPLLKLPRERRVYLHHFVADDKAREPHDHPKGFLSIGLWGRYIERVYEILPPRREELVWASTGRRQVCEWPARARCIEDRIWIAPWWRRFPAEHTHRILVPDGETCWTLVITGPITRTWGFWTRDGWVAFRDYFAGKWSEAGGES